VSRLEDESGSLEGDSFESVEMPLLEGARDSEDDADEPHVSEESDEFRGRGVMRIEGVVSENGVDGEEKSSELIREFRDDGVVLDGSLGKMFSFPLPSGEHLDVSSSIGEELEELDEVDVAEVVLSVLEFPSETRLSFEDG